LVDEDDLRELEDSSAHIRGVRYAGTVAGAIQLALNGQGILAAPRGDLAVGLPLVKAGIKWSGRKINFDLLVDERAPVGVLVTNIVQALATASES